MREKLWIRTRNPDEPGEGQPDPGQLGVFGPWVDMSDRTESGQPGSELPFLRIVAEEVNVHQVNRTHPNAEVCYETDLGMATYTFKGPADSNPDEPRPNSSEAT